MQDELPRPRLETGKPLVACPVSDEQHAFQHEFADKPKYRTGATIVLVRE